MWGYFIVRNRVGRRTRKEQHQNPGTTRYASYVALSACSTPLATAGIGLDRKFDRIIRTENANRSCSPKWPRSLNEERPQCVARCGAVPFALSHLLKLGGRDTTNVASESHRLAHRVSSWNGPLDGTGPSLLLIGNFDSDSAPAERTLCAKKITVLSTVIPLRERIQS